MGTRGAYGFRIGNQDKLTYNHFDSYPSHLGHNVAEFVRTTGKTDLRAIAEKIQLVGDTKPTPEQIEKYRAYADTSVSRQTVEEWYVLLRRAQGDLSLYKDDLDVMIDGNSFVLDSLFCEWAYVIDIDSDTLEIYKGFQKVPGDGRYNREFQMEECHDGSKVQSDYTGVVLAYSVPLGVIRALTAGQLEEFIGALEMVIRASFYGVDDNEEAKADLDEAEDLLAKLMATPPRDTVITEDELAFSTANAKTATDLLRIILAEQESGHASLSDALLTRVQAYLENEPSA